MRQGLYPYTVVILYVSLMQELQPVKPLSFQNMSYCPLANFIHLFSSGVVLGVVIQCAIRATH